jgi:hypothetical protein
MITEELGFTALLGAKRAGASLSFALSSFVTKLLTIMQSRWRI